MRPHRRVSATAIAATLLATTACGGPPSPPHTQSSAPVSWTECGERGTCAEVADTVIAPRLAPSEGGESKQDTEAHESGSGEVASGEPLPQRAGETAAAAVLTDGQIDAIVQRATSDGVVGCFGWTDENASFDPTLASDSPPPGARLEHELAIRMVRAFAPFLTGRTPPEVVYNQTCSAGIVYFGSRVHVNGTRLRELLEPDTSSPLPPVDYIDTLAVAVAHELGHWQVMTESDKFADFIRRHNTRFPANTSPAHYQELFADYDSSMIVSRRWASPRPALAILSTLSRQETETHPRYELRAIAFGLGEGAQP